MDVSENFHYVFHHVFMPLRLPQSYDQPEEDFTLDHELASAVFASARRFVEMASEDPMELGEIGGESSWKASIHMLESLAQLHNSHPYTEDELKEHLMKLDGQDSLALLVRKQNAGLVFRIDDVKVIVEGFTASLPNEEVMTCQSRIVRHFPEASIAFARDYLHNEEFVSQLACVVAQLNAEDIEGAKSLVVRAGSTVEEPRNPPSSEYIMNWLLTTLAALDAEIPPPIRRIVKRTSDDILWSSTYLPWRRSPLWLVIRTSLQLAVGDVGFKTFMVFFLSELLEMAPRHNFADDSLSQMRTKLARRAAKVEEAHGLLQFVRLAFESANAQAESFLRGFWEGFRQTLDNPPPSVIWCPSELDFTGDTRLKLKYSRPYLSKVLARSSKPHYSTPHSPKHPPRILQTSFQVTLTMASAGGLFASSSTEERAISLLDFEALVARDLRDWVLEKVQVACETDMSGLFAAIKSYTLSAKVLYCNNPEQLSQMFLTVLDLWMALDRLVLRTIPLLSSYPCDITPSFLETMLLKQPSDLDRVSRLAQYLHSRKSEAPSVFAPPKADSFSVLFFAQSSKLQDVRKAVEAAAAVKISSLHAVIRQKNTRYHDLISQAEGTPHVHSVVQRSANLGGPQVDKTNCPSCKLSKKARKLKIPVYERPLPTNDNDAMNVIFEACPPSAYAIWREATFFVLTNLAGDANNPPTPKLWVSLPNYLTTIGIARPTKARLSLASVTKPFSKSHYKRVKLPTTPDRVIVNHSLQWRLVDSDTALVDVNVLSHLSLSMLKSPVLGESPYKNLDFSVHGTSHTVNQVLADHPSCSQSITIHEFVTFGSLRAGPQVQWLNLCTALAGQALSFNQPAVYQLVAQAITQVGTVESNGTLLSHLSLESEPFCEQLLEVVESMLSTISDNWQELNTMRLLVDIAIRVLGAQTKNPVAKRVLDFLGKARAALFAWMRGRLNQTSQISPQRLDFHRQRIADIALACRQTFDVDELYFSLTCISATDIRDFLASHMIIQLMAFSPTHRENPTPSWLAIIASRDQRIAHRWEPFVRQQCLTDSTGLNAALSLIWPLYAPDPQPWTSLPGAQNRWISSATAADENRPSQSLHLNLLSGQLLVDGRSMGVLPQDIVDSFTYRRLFGQTVVEVMPSYLAGCDYMSRSPINGYKVFFGYADTKPLVRALPHSSRDHGRGIIEYITEGVFLRDLPWNLARDSVQWIDLTSRVIEFRPAHSPWLSSPAHWRLFLDTSRLRHGLKQQELVEPSSRTFSMLYARVHNLEDVRWVMMIHLSSDVGSPLALQLPRFRLSFLLDREHWALSSQDFPGMFIDDNQGIGTLHGLQSRLVLREAGEKLAGLSIHARRIIVPSGDVRYSYDAKHVTVVVDTKPSSESQAAYLSYLVDTELGRLTSSHVSLESRLFRVYLHTLTSCSIRDELTSRTGAEEALIELYSAACLSFERLVAKDLELLHAIRMLTPVREFYPAGLRCMHRVHWQDLPSTIQLTGFERRVREILEYNNALTIFEQLSDTGIGLIHTKVPSDSMDLLRRTASREPSCVTIRLLTKCSLDAPTKDIIHKSSQMEIPQSHHFRGARMVATMATSSPYVLNPGTFKLQEWLQTGVLTVPQTTTHSLDFTVQFFGITSTALRDRWLSMFYEAASHGSLSSKQFRLLFLVSALLYPPSRPSQVTASLLVSAVHHAARLASIPRPQYPVADITLSPKNSSESLKSLVRKHVVTELTCEDIQSVVQALSRQYQREGWGMLSAPAPFTSSFSRELFPEVEDLFNTWTSAHVIRSFVAAVSNTFQEYLKQGFTSLSSNSYIRWSSSPALFPPTASFEVYPLSELVHRIPPPAYVPMPTLASIPHAPLNLSKYVPQAHANLNAITKQLTRSGLTFPSYFATEVLASRDALSKFSPNNISQLPFHVAALRDTTADSYSEDYRQFTSLLSAIQGALMPQNKTDMLLFTGALWPDVSLRDLLALLTWLHYDSLPSSWRNVLIELSLRLIQAQKSRRAAQKLTIGDHHEDHVTRNLLPIPRTVALQHPDWLLIQIESNILARAVQLTVATEMYRPSGVQNATLQLNMGEGKSSVIVPLVAASLANGEQLVRVVSLKPLIPSMFAILRDKVASLPNRRVAYFPFSRDILRQPGDVLGRLSSLYDQVKRQRGLLLAQPEYILSPKLLSIERMLAQDWHPAQAKAAHQLHLQLRDSARDVLDECDEELAVSYQLIYTVGDPVRVDWHPHRWVIIQRVLGASLAALGRTSNVKLIHAHRWTYPHVFCVSENAASLVGASLKSFFITQLALNRVLGINLRHLDSSERSLAGAFVTQLHPPPNSVAMVDGQRGHIKNGLLLLRGLLAFGILPYCLVERRWRVDYGLDQARSSVAVPFTANDVPSPASEFAHPDLTIVLTCLAYYYYGLSQQQVKDTLAHLLTLSDCTAHYSRWMGLIPYSTLRSEHSLRHLAGLNLDDVDQLDAITTVLRANRQTINFYLREFVFPKAAKTFPYKLQTSGWDLAERRTHSVTGFSGTKDNHHLLPLSIQFIDPAEQTGTNALVLLHVLNPENSRYHVTDHRPEGRQLINTILSMPENVRVLLDIGAQVLDMTNLEVAKYWLKGSQADAAIFFDHNDTLTVVRRDETFEPFHASIYREQTSRCLVYLDDAHTRGTDLKLPQDWQAVVTLGKKVTKDRLMQGCMRLRQLGSGQTLAFFAPPEVDHAIRQIAKKSPKDKVQVQDIVLWSMLETCHEMEHNGSAWAAQALDYNARRSALDALQPSSLGPHNQSALRAAWLQKEARSLHEMYHPMVADKTLLHALQDPTLKARLSRLGVTQTTIRFNNVGEEQEREVTHEIEAEPEVSPPAKLLPAVPSLHPDVLALTTGTYNPSSSVFMTIDEYFWEYFFTSWGKLGKMRHVFSRKIVVTRDFAQTLQVSKAKDFIPPVRWILRLRPFSVAGPFVLVILSQFEANSLLPLMRDPNVAQLHSYLPKISPTMRAFDRFDFCGVPHSQKTPNPVSDDIVVQLNLFAGQLYPTSYTDYLKLAVFLGVDPTGHCHANYDGFVPPQHRSHGPLVDDLECSFYQSPFAFFQELVSLRRKAQTFDNTPVGLLLGGWWLTEKDFEKAMLDGEIEED
ncbi:hypothetical protein DL96DRAFT_1599589 [Flagelloscypha sp. PMI_526]|nr:hypothetical protein DL96DRAFT_1599589 [Flagelloscypha sp. PMI_526]